MAKKEVKFTKKQLHLMSEVERLAEDVSDDASALDSKISDLKQSVNRAVKAGIKVPAPIQRSVRNMDAGRIEYDASDVQDAINELTE
jgi:hypothetical protein